MKTATTGNTRQFLAGGGEMGERIRNFDWTKTPLGPIEDWEQSLKTCVRIMLTSSQPIWIGWGNDLIKLYNDPYKAIVGGKHPEALGQPASVVWSDIWKDIEPLLKQVMEKDEGTYVESQLLIMERNNYAEETYYTFSYTPIPGDKGGTAGMICANTDDTVRIINERALQTLSDLGKLHYTKQNKQEIYTKAAEVLANNTKDFPSAAFYEVDEKNMQARPVAWAGKKENYDAYPQLIVINELSSESKNIRRAINNNEIVLSENMGRRPNAPKGFWPIPPKQFLHIPIKLSNHKLPCAILAVGLNPFRKYDHAYQQFIRLLADQLSLEINNMHVLEEERKRAEGLAEIDKAKTVFFNNISHEFRTPLTLILGPLEELMKQPQNQLSLQNLANIETTHRNAMRLLKLVNTLLDFSRIESGRQQANFTLVDIATFTKDLASSFRSLIEKAGLTLTVHADSVIQPVYVDKQMWEKIVFNLLSNAFKYTLQGSITVKLFTENAKLVLQVMDTGIGIPEKELPHMFERFHRIEGASGRTHEGTGIGLSMIKELIHLNKGTIKVESKEGKGSMFTVTIPTGKDHLTFSQINNKGQDFEETISNAYVEEATILLDSSCEKHSTGKVSAGENEEEKKTIILIVDDNADMRAYLKTLLEKTFYVITANNGMDALHRIKEQTPSIILSDIMMPIMDGVQLLQEIKQNVKTAAIPVILLTARAGEEARIKGYDIGADDYLVKPFSAKELLARIRSQLKIAATRKHTEQQLKNLFMQAPIAMCIFRGPEYIVEVANEKMLELWGKNAGEVLNKPVFIGMPDAKDQGFEQLLDSVYKTGRTFVANELPINLLRKGRLEKVFVKFVYEALFNEDGSVSGVMALADEITEQVMARQKIEDAEERVRLATEAAELATWDLDLQNDQIIHSSRLAEIFGYHSSEKLAHDQMRKQIHPDDLNKIVIKAFELALQTGTCYYEARVVKPDKKISWVRVQGKVFYDNENQPVKLIGTLKDITEEKNNQRILQESELKFRLLADSMPQLIWTGDAMGNLNYFNQAIFDYSGLTPGQIVDGWMQTIHPDDREESLKEWANSLTTGKDFLFEHRFRKHDGEYRWQLSRAIPQKDLNGNIQMWVGTSTDIQDQKIFANKLEKKVHERTQELKKINEELIKSEERYHLMVEEVQDYAILYLNRQGIIENWNKGAERIEGYKASEIIGKNFSVFYTTEDKQNNLPETLLNQAVVSGKALQEGWRVRKDGSLFWASIVITAVHNAENNVIGFSKVTHDLTEKKDIIDKLKINAEQIEQKNKALEKMNAELQSFAYVSSHDLQEPLRKIQTFAARIIEKESQNLSATGSDYFMRIQRSANRMQILIEDLLAYSRTNTTERVFTKMDLKQIVAEVKNDLKETLAEKQATLDTDEMCQADIIPFQFRQLMFNLIGNSLKFSKPEIPAQIKLQSKIVTTAELETDILPSQKKYCHITVSDNGIGFDPLYKERIFEVFQRLHGKEEYAGTGIGLAIVKKIVENHNGVIQATSELDKGSRFDIYIPVL